MKKSTFIYLVLFLLSSLPLQAQNDVEEEKNSLDKYYQMKTFGQYVLMEEEEGINSYMFYIGKMNDEQYRFFYFLLEKNAPFKVKKTWDKQFVHIETTEENFNLIKPKLLAAKNEVEQLWKSSSNPLLEMERRMR